MKTAINSLKSGKSPGINNIHAEFLKSGGDITAKVLQRLFNNIVDTGIVPQQFKDAMIVVIFKKGIRQHVKTIVL